MNAVILTNATFLDTLNVLIGQGKEVTGELKYSTLRLRVCRLLTI
jgi:hypothetical protein